MSSFFFSSRRRHTRFDCDWSSDVCSSDLRRVPPDPALALAPGVALQVGGGAVVHDAAVGGPRPAPLQVRAPHAAPGGPPARRAVLGPGPGAAPADPPRARRRPPAFPLGEPFEMLV